MATELEHPGFEPIPPHLEIGLSDEEEQELNFLMVKASNCKANLANNAGDGTMPTLILEAQLADLQYKHRWTEISLHRLRAQHLLDQEELALQGSRIDALEYHFSKALKETITTAMIDYQRADDFNRMLAVYKNGLKAGARHEREKLQK